MMAPTVAFPARCPSLVERFAGVILGHFHFSVQDRGTTGGVLAAAKFLTQLCFQDDVDVPQLHVQAQGPLKHMRAR